MFGCDNSITYDTKQHKGMARPGVRQVPEGSGEQEKMEENGHEIICGALMTLSVRGSMMMMMMLTAALPSASHSSAPDSSSSITAASLTAPVTRPSSRFTEIETKYLGFFHLDKKQMLELLSDMTGESFLHSARYAK